MGAIRKLIKRFRGEQSSDGVAFGGIQPRVVSHKAMWGGDFAVAPRADWTTSSAEAAPKSAQADIEEDLRQGEFWFLEEGDSEEWSVTNPGQMPNEDS